ncbi:MAG: hypothetical protein HRT47_03840 [Candidatus Caenarcaniphilales bacterium]|nr:hypothetical protein [Candidatus Caenarcaniphilales bacterium]
MTIQPGGINFSEIAKSLNLTEGSMADQLWSALPDILGSINHKENSPETKVNPYSHQTKKYSGTSYGNLAYLGVQESNEKVAGVRFKDKLSTKLGKAISGEQAINIYSSLVNSGKISNEYGKNINTKIDDYYRTTLAAVIGSASDKEIEDSFSNNPDLAKKLIDIKSGSSSEDIVEKFTNLDTETLSQIHDSLEKGSPLAKYFNFNSNGVTVLSSAEQLKSKGLLKEDNEFTKHIDNAKNDFNQYMESVWQKIDEIPNAELETILNSSSSSSSHPNSARTDSFVPSQHANNPYAQRLYSQAYREIDAVSNLDSRQRSLYLNGLSGNPLVNSGDLFASNLYQDISGTNLDYLWGG